ncbi:MAG: PfkB family carbohydrate kinase [Candidatus Latescibacterota bacterium]|nr:PfkB family carbohydrate kinase [Candidatus Latescibacterota bacterium]
MLELTPTRLRALLDVFPSLRVGVIGDFFLDAYFDCDPALDEKSLETGRTCYQVVRHRRQVGAAGTVAANLRALGVGTIEAVGYCGDDGEGYELRRAMRELELDLAGFITAADRFTPTYGKPCYIDGNQRSRPVIEELERLDAKNRRPTPAALQDQIIAHIHNRLHHWDAAVLLDQVAEANCGVLTSRVRRALASALDHRSRPVVLADSRERIGLFKDAILKPNQREAMAALDRKGRPSLKIARDCAQTLSERTGYPVFLTLGTKGMLVADGHAIERISAVRVAGPVDIVGAGDACSAAISTALAAGAHLTEAAALASLAASITVQQLGTTGTARPTQIRRRLQEVRRGL